MIHVAFYFVLLIAVFSYAAMKGGRPERLASLILMVGSVASFALPFDRGRSFHSVEIAELLVDLAVLGGFTAVAIFANRFWPIWLAALHLVGVAVHGVKGYQPDLLPSIYAAATHKLGYGLLLIIAAGVIRHRRRQAIHGADRDWSYEVRGAA